MVTVPAMTPDDPAHTLLLLAEHRSSGEYVLHSARMVGDEDDHALWSQSCRVWRTAAAATIIAHFPANSDAFDRASRPPVELGDWKRQYQAEIRAVTALLELLGTLADAADRRAVESEAEPAHMPARRALPRAASRRGPRHITPTPAPTAHA